jgi:DNA polymerase bacteriophage-type
MSKPSDGCINMLSEAEQQLWELDQKINDRGFHVDRELAIAARKIVEQERAAIDARLTQLTEGVITTAHQRDRILNFVNERGHRMKSLNKRSVSAVLAREPDEATRQVLELRRAGARASAGKLDTLLAGLSDDDRFRGGFRYHGAATGRWSGSRFQPQNLKKKVETPSLDAAIEVVRAGDIERVRQFGPPLTVVGDMSRALITAAPGHVLIGADSSAIESRVLAWLAGETWKLKTYREYDRTGDPAFEPYCVTASKILRRRVTFADEAGREQGKTCELAFQYGSAVNGYRNFDPSNTYSDAEVEVFKQQWRASHPATVRFWHALHYFAKRTIRFKRKHIFNRLVIELDGTTLTIKLLGGPPT